MRLQKYQYQVFYKGGKLMYLADTLSRAHPDFDGNNPQGDIEQINMVSYLPISDHRLNMIKIGTKEDEDLQLLMALIHNGWPEDKENIPTKVMPYFHHRHELSARMASSFEVNE